MVASSLWPSLPLCSESAFNIFELALSGERGQTYSRVSRLQAKGHSILNPSSSCQMARLCSYENWVVWFLLKVRAEWEILWSFWQDFNLYPMSFFELSWTQRRSMKGVATHSVVVQNRVWKTTQHDDRDSRKASMGIGKIIVHDRERIFLGNTS